MSNVSWSLLDEPAVENAPGPQRRDWVLVALFVLANVAEGFLRSDLVWPVLAVAVGIALAALFPFRRTHPLACVAAGFTTGGAISIVSTIAVGASFGTYSSAFVLVFVYALFRWGSGRHGVIGLGFCLFGAAVSIVTDYTGLGDAIGGTIILLFSAALGATIRYRATAQRQRIDGARSAMREELARELHDTVAHHVSAIAVQAQAGQVLARAQSLEGAAEALATIEDEATRTLGEMRSIVEALRDPTETADFAPQRGVADIARLAGSDPSGTAGSGSPGAGSPGTGSPASPRVAVTMTGDLVGLGPALDRALYRLAQESITNAIRHARGATRISVTVHGGPAGVQLLVDDDGEPATVSAAHGGFGLIGMAERVNLLGGTIDAGPSGDRGWRVRIDLPKATVTT